MAGAAMVRKADVMIGQLHEAQAVPKGSSGSKLQNSSKSASVRVNPVSGTLKHGKNGHMERIAPQNFTPVRKLQGD